MATKKSSAKAANNGIAKQTKALPAIDPTKAYTLSEALQMLKASPSARFDETVDVALNLGVDPKYNDQMVRGVVALPHGNGKTVKVAVVAKGQAAEDAKAAGADLVGADDLIAKIAEGQLGFDKLVATPDMMPLLGKVAKVLGPKGLMPNPKLGTVTPNVTKAVKELKAGLIEFKVEKAGIIHAGVGKKSFTEANLTANIKALVKAVKDAKPSGAKTNYMLKLTVSTTMGRGIRVDLASV